MTVQIDWNVAGDADLVGAAAAGDRAAFAGIYDRYADRLYDFCLGIVGDRDAADCVQEAFFMFDGERWRLTGSSGSQLGICAAQRILLSAQTDDGGERWFALDTSSQNAALTVEPQQGTDLCTDVGVLRLVDFAVPAGAEVRGISTERARCIVAAFVACAAAGTVRRCADAATDYIRTREQFGKPVGAFQALQHKAAVLLVNSELAAAAAWDAVRAADESVEQHRLAAASAALMKARAPCTLSNCGRSLAMICWALEVRSSRGFNVMYMRPLFNALPPPPIAIATPETSGSARTIAPSCS